VGWGFPICYHYGYSCYGGVMSNLVRFGVSLEKGLLNRFDALNAAKSFANRSEAIRDLIREKLVERRWQEGGKIAGAISIVYDHHKRELVNRLLNIQHRCQGLIVSSQHIHLDHDNCLEVIVVKGNARDAQRLCAQMRSCKGVKYGGMTLGATGEDA